MDQEKKKATSKQNQSYLAKASSQNRNNSLVVQTPQLYGLDRRIKKLQNVKTSLHGEGSVCDLPLSHSRIHMLY